MRSQDRDTRGDKVVSRTADTTSEGERGAKQVKSICQFCGWEVSKPEWYNKQYDRSGYVCDNCLMDNATEREKEKVR